METRIDILNELKQISSFLVGMDKVNVFTVPPGYFDSVSETVMACLREEGRLFANAKDTLSLPPNYFENLAETILNKIKAQETASEEIKDLSPLLSTIQNINVFEVPEGYFEQLNQVILHRTNIISSKEELQELSPMLYGIQNKNVFEVPADYFNTLPGTVINKVHPTATVVNMWSRFAKYASAAVIVGAIAFGLYKYTDKPATSSRTSNKVSVATLDPSIEKGRIMDDKQFAEALKNLTDADIVNYLENHGDITDMATLGKNLDDALLPTQEEYLLDANTLDDFLYKIETTAKN
jgi:hypothetical protein